MNKADYDYTLLERLAFHGCFVLFLVYPMILAKRIENEEKFLEEQLAGYREYREKVKYKMIPFIW